MKKRILEIGNWPPPVCSWSMSLVGLRKELEARGWDCQVMNLNENRRVRSPEYIDVQSGPDYFWKVLRHVWRGYAVHVRVNGETKKGYLLALAALLLARMAQRAHEYSIVRSLTHTGINHGTSAYHMLTGHIHWSPGTLRHPTKADMPNIGCNAARFLEHPDYLPAHVQLPAIIHDGDTLPVPGQEPGILGEKHVPFRVLGDLTQRDFQVPSLKLAAELSTDRVGRRAGLREAIDGHLAITEKHVGLVKA